MLEYALDWAGRGFRLFPLHPGTKRPVWRGWTQDATSDPARIKEIWSERDYNIGVLTGNGLLVVDVDIKNGKDGMWSFFNLGIPADTLCVETVSGGKHFYYKTDTDVANSSGKIGEGLDVRGKNGFVIAPGSVLAGGAYRVSSDIGRIGLPLLTSFVLAAFHVSVPPTSWMSSSTTLPPSPSPSSGWTSSPAPSRGQGEIITLIGPPQSLGFRRFRRNRRGHASQRMEPPLCAALGTPETYRSKSPTPTPTARPRPVAHHPSTSSAMWSSPPPQSAPARRLALQG